MPGSEYAGKISGLFFLARSQVSGFNGWGAATMSKDRPIIALLLALLAGLFLSDLFLFPARVLPTAVYAVPALFAAWALPPRPVGVIAAVGGFLQLLSGFLQGASTASIVFNLGAFALLGILAVALSARMRREAELARLASEEREQLRFLMENTRDIIFRLDLLPARNYRYVSPAIREILGYTPEEMYADPGLTERLVHPEDLPSLHQLAAAPLPERTVTFRALHRDGHVVWLEQRNVAIYDSAGRVIGYEGVARDVTERKMTEEELLQTNAELEAVFRALPDLFLRLDREDRVIDYEVGRGMELFAPAESMLGKRVEEVLREEAAARIAGAIAQVRLTRELATVEYTLPFPKGDRVYESRFLPFLGEQVIVVVRDITVLHELQESLRDLIRGLSHDLRSPLTAVLGQSQILQRALEKQGADRSIIASANSVVAGAMRMNDMIAQLADATRIESGQLPIDVERVDVRQFLPDLLSRTAQALEAERIALDVPADLPDVAADPGHLERICLNLLSNALKYSDPGTPVVVRAEAAGGFVRVSVIDRGPGIAEEEIPKLFGRFYRAGRTSRAEGMGMGLYITKMLVEAQGGEVSVESEVGVGSTFSFTVPAGAP